MSTAAKVRFPLRVKIAGLAAGVAVVSVGALALFTVLLPYRAGQAEMERRVATAAREIARGSVVAGLGHIEVDEQALAADVDNADKIGSHVAYALLLDGAGQPDLERSRVNLTVLSEFAPELAVAWEGGRRSEVLARLAKGMVEGPHLARTVTIQEAGGALVGRIMVGCSLKSLRDVARRNLLLNLAVLAGALLLAVGGALLFAGTLSGPIRDLSLAMEKVRAGDLDQKVSTASGDEVGALAHSFNEMTAGLRERIRLKSTLERYVSSDVAERILAEKSDLDVKGELVPVTVLFLDIRGFTTLSERLPPREVVDVLNEYFEAIIDVIFANQGTINHFIGDAVMAIYGAPRHVAEPEFKAVRTAIEIQRRVLAKNGERQKQGKEPIAIGIGINTGVAIAGNIGSEKRMEYTVIGDDVNLAQRMEALARENQIVISQSTYERVADAIEATVRAPVKVKGKSKPVQAYEVRWLKESTGSMAVWAPA